MYGGIGRGVRGSSLAILAILALLAKAIVVNNGAPPCSPIVEGINGWCRLLRRRPESFGYDRQAEEHWFGVREPATLCACCWQASSCLREFVYPAKTQETLLGRLPLSTRAAQTLLKGVRPWIEAAQSFEKNQLGLSQIFFNSLRLAWCTGLLADSVCLLRAHALLQQSGSSKALLADLAPRQMIMNLV